MNDFIYVSVDCETTGLSVDNCDILEFGAVLDNLSVQAPIEELPRFHCYFLPPENGMFKGEPYALSMHPTIFRRIAEKDLDVNHKNFLYLHPNNFGYRFKAFLANNGYQLEKDRITITVAGKNFGSFDLPFLEKKTDIAKHVKIRHRIIDPSILFLQNGDETLPGISTCKTRMGETDNVAHTAIEDAIDVIKMVRYKLGPIFKKD